MAIKQSTANWVPIRLVDASESPVTGLAFNAAAITNTFKLGKSGAAAATFNPASSGDWIEDGNGYYRVQLSTTDCNTLGLLTLIAVTTTGQPWEAVERVEANLVADTFSRVGAPAGASVSADIATIAGYIDTEVAAIKAKTDNLPSTPASQGDVTTVGTAVATLSTKVGTPAGASVSVDIAAVKTDTAAIKLKTDNLPASPAAVGSNMGSVTSVTNDVGGKVLGGGAGTIIGTGVRAVDGSGNAIAPASTALSTAQWTNTRAGLVDNLDAAVTTRAAAATALSTAQWTNGRAALLDHLDADITSRLATIGYTAPDNTSITAIKAKTDNLPAAPASTGDVTTVGTAVATLSTKVGTPAGATVSADIAAAKVDTAAIKAKTDNLPANPASQTNLDVAVSTRLAAGSYTAPDNTSITAIKAKTDNLPANPASQTNLDVAVSTRLAAGSYTAPDNTSITAIKAKTDNLPSDPADQSLVIAATDAVMARLGAPAGASVSADVAAVGASAATAATAAGSAATAAGSAQTAAESALAAATNALHAALGLYLVIEPITWDGADSVTVRCRLYDNKAHSVTNDGVTGLVVPSFVRTVSYSATELTGAVHRPTKISGVEP